MEESISGFRVHGTWTEIVEHGERISRALRETGVDDDALAAWEEWRPKPHERIETEVSKKTADKASIREGPGEREGASPDEDFRTAGHRLSESFEELEADDPDAAMEKWHDSMDHVVRAADSAGRKMIRRVENTVYKKVMTQLAPYYFDDELVSANIQRVRGASDEERFSFEVNVNDDELKQVVSTKLAEYEDVIDRWHVDTEKAVETAEAAEGVEVTREELESTTAKPPRDRLEEPISANDVLEADADDRNRPTPNS